MNAVKLQKNDKGSYVKNLKIELHNIKTSGIYLCWMFLKEQYFWSFVSQKSKNSSAVKDHLQEI